MISLEKSKKILNKGERKYTDEEVKEIRDTLEIMARLQIETENYRANKEKEPKSNWRLSLPEKRFF